MCEGGKAERESLGASVRERRFVSRQRLCMCTWPLDSGAVPGVPAGF